MLFRSAAGSTDQLWRATAPRKEYCEHQTLAQLLWILEANVEGEVVETRAVGQLGDSDAFTAVGQAAAAVLRFVWSRDLDVS